jgi:hypothetical protein
MIPGPHALLSTAYLPPVQFISKFFVYHRIYIEKHENYQKQSYRNRCCIYGANGKQCLVIPVIKLHGKKMPVTEVAIDYTTNWQKIHLKSIESAYRLSPFYEYYADDFLAIYDQKIPLLFDWNMKLLKTILNLLKNDVIPEETTAWIPADTHYPDYRQSINPKKRLTEPDTSFEPIPYQQVFREKFGFIPNLSIIDLLFNEGPETKAILLRSIRT